MGSATPVSVHPAARVGAAIPLILVVGIGVGVAVLGMVESTLSRTAGCVDPGLCDAAAVGDFLPRWTSAKLLPQQIEWAGFRSLTAVGLALTLLLLGVVALNVCTLVLAGSSALRAEFALRTALGARPLALVRQVRGRAVRLGVGALGAGVAIGLAGGLALRMSWPLGEAPWEIGLGSARAPSAAVAGLVMMLVASLLWPVGVGWSRNLRRHLASGARATTGPAEAVVRDALVVVQVAASLVVLVGAGLLVDAYLVSSAPPAARVDGDVRSLVANVRLPGSADAPASPAERARQFQAIMDRVRMVPGVVDSSVASEGSWIGLGVTDRVMALCLECRIGTSPKQQTSGPARIHSVGAGFLEAVGSSPRSGRSIRPGDDGGAPGVAVVSNAFAVEFFPRGEPLGKEVRLGGPEGEWVRVVGVVDDLQVAGLGSDGVSVPAIYLSILQYPPSEAGLLVRVEDDRPGLPEAVSIAASREIPGLRIGEPAPLEHLLASYRSPLRWFGMLFGVLAALVVLVVTTGLHGIISHNVRGRTRELGIRMALGAEERAVMRLVVGHTLRLVGVGVVVGIVPLSGIARLLQLGFQGVDPWNPALAIGTAALLAAAAVAASYAPARRAARVDPQVALREA